LVGTRLEGRPRRGCRPGLGFELPQSPLDLGQAPRQVASVLSLGEHDEPKNQQGTGEDRNEDTHDQVPIRAREY